MIDDSTAKMMEEIRDWKLTDSERQLCYKIHAAPMYQPIPVNADDSVLIRKFIRQRNLKVRRSLRDRLVMISDRIKGDKPQGITVLDIGCNVGFFGFTLENQFRMPSKFRLYLGIDSDSSCIAAANALKDYRKLADLNFMEESLMDVVPRLFKDGIRFDYCLFLSTYHHLLGQYGLGEARKILGWLGEMCPVMFFDCGQKDEPNNESRAYWHDALPDMGHNDFIHHEVANHTNYTNIEILGVSDVSGRKGRILYRFNRN